MFKRFLSLKVSIPVAALALIGGGFYTLQALADYTPGSYLDAQTFMVSWHMTRLGASSISCTGLCRSAQTGGANPLLCRINEAAQATTTACLTALGTDCTPQNVVNCSTGEHQ